MKSYEQYGIDFAFRDAVLQELNAGKPCLSLCCPLLRNDEEIVRIALKISGFQLQWASSRLKNNPAIALLAMETSEGCYTYTGRDLKEQVRKMQLAYPNMTRTMALLTLDAQRVALELAEAIDTAKAPTKPREPLKRL